MIQLAIEKFNSCKEFQLVEKKKKKKRKAYYIKCNCCLEQLLRTILGYVEMNNIHALCTGKQRD